MEPDTNLWCVSLPASHDIFAAPSRTEAADAAQGLREVFHSMGLAVEVLAPRWPYSPDAHAERLEQDWGQLRSAIDAKRDARTSNTPGDAAEAVDGQDSESPTFS